MAEVEEFFRLREFDSLSREAAGYRAAMHDELTRLKRRESELSDRKELLEQRVSDMRTLEHNIAELDRRLAARLSPEAKEKLDEEGLQLLIKQQELELEIEDHKTFLAGFQKTVDELRLEINTAISLLQLKCDQVSKRAEATFLELPSDWQQAYRKIAAKNPVHGVFTRLEGLKCQFCRAAVSKVFESEVDTLGMLKSCPSCGRLVLPYKTVAG